MDTHCTFIDPQNNPAKYTNFTIHLPSKTLTVSPCGRECTTQHTINGPKTVTNQFKTLFITNNYCAR